MRLNRVAGRKGDVMVTGRLRVEKLRGAPCSFGRHYAVVSDEPYGCVADVCGPLPVGASPEDVMDAAKANADLFAAAPEMFKAIRFALELCQVHDPVTGRHRTVDPYVLHAVMLAANCAAQGIRSESVEDAIARSKGGAS